ncbi:MAG: hypothetical protein PHW18_02590 [Sulfuricurvum sp.]|uniref:hypothetical protein n=1 Tax=Sulfuricurvum sp. TaxID=2025608 RepID=UPI0026131F9A|nr:hypothetical protein [Sulfuricurvum sp.]MDD2828444.1 hypothetical protein [Sulfuricurvum sp.]MDD4949449.1 hypothetical protein [Sulfuricurvum sp.]
MDKVTLVLTLIGLLFSSMVLVFLYIVLGRPKKGIESESNEPLSFKQLEAIIHSSTSSNKALNSAANEILSRFISITDISHYQKLIEAISTHANTDSNLISNFEKRLRDANPKYKEDIRKALKEGLGKRDKK